MAGANEEGNLMLHAVLCHLGLILRTTGCPRASVCPIFKAWPAHLTEKERDLVILIFNHLVKQFGAQTNPKDVKWLRTKGLRSRNN